MLVICLFKLLLMQNEQIVENEAKPHKSNYEDLKDIDISNLLIIQNDKFM